MNQDSLFQSKLVPAKPGSEQLFDEELTANDSAGHLPWHDLCP